jgi:tetratricopeptide (TPR) repeat protein
MMTRSRTFKNSLVLAMVSLFVAAAPSSWAQEDQWDKHVKAGRKDFAQGMREKYFHGWGDARPYPSFGKAQEEFLAALAAAQAFPAGDLRIAATLGELADAYSEEGKFAEAENRGNQAITTLEASLPSDDPRLGYALVGVAMIYSSEDKPEQAAPTWARALAILKKAGGLPPEAQKKLDFVAANLKMSGKSRGAEQILRFLLELKESTGVSDQDLRVALFHLARAQRGADAEQSYSRILDIDKRVYGPNDPAAAGDLESFGKFYVEEGNYAAAWPLLQRSLDILQKSPPPAHESKIDKGFDASHLARVERQLAEAYAESGKDREAEELYKRLVSMEETDPKKERVLNEMSLTEDLRGLARVYRDEHRYDEALETIKRSATAGDEVDTSKFEKAKAARGRPPTWSWFSQNELAEIYREKGDLAAAEPLFQKSVEMAPTLPLAPGHPKLAQLFDNYATLLRDEGKYTEAEPLYKRALDIWAKSRYPEHPELAKTLMNYAALLRKLDRASEAEPLEARASAMHTKIAASKAVR